MHCTASSISNSPIISRTPVARGLGPILVVPIVISLLFPMHLMNLFPTSTISLRFSLANTSPRYVWSGVSRASRPPVILLRTLYFLSDL